MPRHDGTLVLPFLTLSPGLELEAAAQGMAGTQRAFFNLLAARGGVPWASL